MTIRFKHLFFMVRRTERYSYWARFRCANFMRWQLGPVVVEHSWFRRRS
jgi:hypothetical protein